MLMAKAHLIIRSIQLKIGHDLLMQVLSSHAINKMSPLCLFSLSPPLPPLSPQVFHKQLTLASSASQDSDFSHWHNLIISTGGVSPHNYALSLRARSESQPICSIRTSFFPPAYNYALPSFSSLIKACRYKINTCIYKI